MNEKELTTIIVFLMGILTYFIKRFVDSVDKLNGTMDLIKKEFNLVENRVIKLEELEKSVIKIENRIEQCETKS